MMYGLCMVSIAALSVQVKSHSGDDEEEKGVSKHSFFYINSPARISSIESDYALPIEYEARIKRIEQLKKKLEELEYYKKIRVEACEAIKDLEDKLKDGKEKVK